MANWRYTVFLLPILIASFIATAEETFKGAASIETPLNAASEVAETASLIPSAVEKTLLGQSVTLVHHEERPRRAAKKHQHAERRRRRRRERWEKKHEGGGVLHRRRGKKGRRTESYGDDESRFKSFGDRSQYLKKRPRDGRRRLRLGGYRFVSSSNRRGILGKHRGHRAVVGGYRGPHARVHYARADRHHGLKHVHRGGYTYSFHK